MHCWQCCNWTYASCWIRWRHIQSVHRLLAKIQTYVATMHLKGQAQKLTPVGPKKLCPTAIFNHAYFYNKPFRHFPWYMLREVTKTKYFFRGERSPPTTLPLFKVHSECLPPRISKTPYQLWLIQFREGFIKKNLGIFQMGGRGSTPFQIFFFRREIWKSVYNGLIHPENE